jgi:hypothetical protein
MKLTPETIEAHCRKPGCLCQHADCYRGWRDSPLGAPRADTTPCERCRPDTHRRWLNREAARAKGYPPEALHRIMAGTRNGD